MFIRRIILPLPLLLQFVFGQQHSGVKKSPQNQALAAAPAPTSDGLTLDGVLAMVQAGLSDDVIIFRLRKEGKPFDLSAEEMIRLKRIHVSDNVLKVMLDPKAEISVPAPAPQQSTVVLPGAAITGVTVANPSGATPNPVAAAGDPDDPMTPHDSGIYLYAKDREGKPKMVVLERAAYQGSKTGGVFTSAMTYGIKKAKVKAILPGAAAAIRTSEAVPTFYFYFEDKAAGLGKSYFGINNLSNPNQFALIRLDQAKSNRETIIGEVGAFGSSTGTHEKSMVTVKSERLRPGLYKVVPAEALRSGEYCFLASSGMGAYGAGAAGAMDIFDFGINGSQ